uniref:Methyltransf_21 domain-containing protein n=1 Tax=Steinernema glaseri TaxID=37863 RepID=A0A1I7ZY67_9BILA
MGSARNVVIALIACILILTLYANMNYLFYDDDYAPRIISPTTEDPPSTSLSQPDLVEQPPYRDERYHLFSQCVYLAFYQIQDIEVWDVIRPVFDYCTRAIPLNTQYITEYLNNDEIKYHIDPMDVNQVTNCHIITLGIGHDVAVEIKLKGKFTQQCKFYGTDPITTLNELIYNPIGEYFPLAVGNETRFEATSVKEDPLSVAYTYRNFSHVELIEFLRDKAQIPSEQVIDQLLVDIEYAEYSIADYFFLDGRLDKAGYTICQWNIEFHFPNDEQKKEFGSFMKRISKDERYLFFNLDNTYHIRLYFVNVADQRCFDRYVKGRI